MLVRLTVPLVCVTAVDVRLRAGRGVTYRHELLGRDDRRFAMFTFKTMIRNTERGPVLAAENDPRVLPGLGWPGRSRLDELPQL